MNEEEVRVAAQGVVALFPELGLLRERVNAPRVKSFPVQGDRVVFAPDLAIPLRPMVGVIGTSPASGKLRTVDVGAHGANLDCPEITTGAKVYMPVAVPGALLGLGDLHAAMGAGEVCGTGVEIGGRVQATVDVIKDVLFPLPIVETADSWYVLSPDLDFGKAARAACSVLLDLMIANWGLSPEDAFMLMSATADVGLCSCFEPGRTSIVAKGRMPKLADCPHLIVGPTTIV